MPFLDRLGKDWKDWRSEPGVVRGKSDSVRFIDDKGFLILKRDDQPPLQIPCDVPGMLYGFAFGRGKDVSVKLDSTGRADSVIVELPPSR